MTGAPEPPGGRLTDQISLGVLSAAFSRDLIEEVLGVTGKREKRSRLLPAHVMVRYVIGLGLFFGQAYEEVMRQMTGTLQSLGSWDQGWKVPSTSAITQARQRLGAGPLRELFHRAAVPVAGLGTRGAWLRGRRRRCSLPHGRCGKLVALLDLAHQVVVLVHERNLQMDQVQHTCEDRVERCFPAWWIWADATGVWRAGSARNHAEDQRGRRPTGGREGAARLSRVP